MTRQEEHALIALAAAARARAYAPYSRFTVGAAVVADDDRTFYGCNIENASLGLTICAERCAIATAAASGARQFRAVVLVTDTPRPLWPCGACLQWIAEFGSGATRVVSATTSGMIRRATLAELLKEPFALTPSLSAEGAPSKPTSASCTEGSNATPSSLTGKG